MDFRRALLITLVLNLSPVVRAEEASGSRRLPPRMDTENRSEGEQAQFIEQLWQAPLGRLLHRLLFELKEGESALPAARAVVDRIYQDVRMTLSRQSALSMLRGSLTANARLTPVVYERLMALDAEMTTRKEALGRKASREFLWTLPVFILAGLPGGSPYVRKSLSHVPWDVWYLARSLVRGRPNRWAKLAVQARLDPRVYLDKPWRRKYSPITAWFLITQSFSLGYIIYQLARTGSADSVPAQNKIWVYGIEKIVSFDEI